MSAIVVKASQIDRRGAFAAHDFRKDEVVVRWDNTREITQEEYAALTKEERTYVDIQDGMILLIGEPERYLNHSCNANTIPGHFCDIAVRDIREGEEITTDYSYFYVPEGRFKCACGEAKCRGIITGKI